MFGMHWVIWVIWQSSFYTMGPSGRMWWFYGEHIKGDFKRVTSIICWMVTQHTSTPLLKLHDMWVTMVTVLVPFHQLNTHSHNSDSIQCIVNVHCGASMNELNRIFIGSMVVTYILRVCNVYTHNAQCTIYTNLCIGSLGRRLALSPLH